MKRRIIRGASLAVLPLALVGSSLSYFSRSIRLQLFGTTQERAIADIEGRAGTYKIDPTLPGKPIVKVDLSFSEINPNSMRLVGKLSHLRQLSLLDTSVTDEDIGPLSALTELRSLNLMSTNVRGVGLTQLKGLTLLQSLNLQCTPLGEEGLASITNLSSLRNLDLAFTGVTDRALAYFRVTDSHNGHAGAHGLVNLASLNLKGTQIDGPGLANLAGLTKLGASP